MATQSRREELHAKLVEILGDASRVYYQPPGGATVRMTYPCIRYTKDRGDHEYADNYNYRFTQGYQIMYIDPNPDSDIPDKILNHFQMCQYDRHYVADNLNHDVLFVYY